MLLGARFTAGSFIYRILGALQVGQVSLCHSYQVHTAGRGLRVPAWMLEPPYNDPKTVTVPLSGLFLEAGLRALGQRARQATPGLLL